MTSYIALLRKEPDSDYGVEFPDFPGCVSAGKDLGEARAMATEALELHSEGGILADGEPLRRPSGLAEIMADPANRETVALLVTVPDQATETVHVDLTCRRPPSVRSTREPAPAASLAPSFWRG